MVDLIGKICTELTANPYVIGIILNCGELFNSEEVIDIEKHEISEGSHLDLCVISKEAVNQETIYIEEGVTVRLRWRSEESYRELIKDVPANSGKKILYDKTGLLKATLYTRQLTIA